MVDRSELDFLDSLSVEEKIGQLIGIYYGVGGVDAKMIDEEDVIELIRDCHVGSVSPISSSMENDPSETIETVNQFQRVALEEKDAGIPLLFTLDAIHGNAYLNGTTIFPHNLGLAASFDRELAGEVASITSEEIRATGGTQNYSPTCDVMREPRWGRCFETFGESPFLVGQMASRKIEGYQGQNSDELDVVATAKHFPAYSEPVRGEDASPLNIDEYTLRRVFLPPFREALEAGAESVMPCYNSLNGEPVHGSKKYLTELLRNELGFEGFVVTDWTGTRMLHTHHMTSSELKDSVKQSLDAGIDVFSIGSRDHYEAILELVEDGEVSIDRIDRSVERIIHAKKKLGLFDEPYIDTEESKSKLRSSENKEVSQRASRESIVLLENNDGVLPINSEEDILLVGPNADNLWNQRGGWSVMERENIEGTTTLEALREIHEGELEYLEVTGINSLNRDELKEIKENADKYDKAVAVMGEGHYIHEFGPSILLNDTDIGEFPTRSRLDLPSPQRKVINELSGQDIELILVLIAGRPVSFNPEKVDAALWACYPGMDGGTSIAEILLGEVNPSAKLPFSYPRDTSYLPQRYNYLRHPHPIGDNEHTPSYDPLYPFGHGENYSEIEYIDLSLEHESIESDGEVSLDVTIENNGDQELSEPVLVYIKKDVSSRVTPNRELIDFRKPDIGIDERETVSIDIPMKRVSRYLHGIEGETESGEYTIIVEGIEKEFSVN